MSLYRCDEVIMWLFRKHYHIGKNIRGILCLSFFLVLIFHWLTAWGYEWWCFAFSTKYKMWHYQNCTVFSVQCHNRAPNKWLKKVNVISTSNLCFHSLLVLQWIYARPLWKTFSTDVSLFRHLFCVVLTFGKFHPINHHFWS